MTKGPLGPHVPRKLDLSVDIRVSIDTLRGYYLSGNYARAAATARHIIDCLDELDALQHAEDAEKQPRTRVYPAPPRSPRRRVRLVPDDDSPLPRLASGPRTIVTEVPDGRSP